jgi:hypothetical protein
MNEAAKSNQQHKTRAGEQQRKFTAAVAGNIGV